jgi:hypothetical protein
MPTAKRPRPPTRIIRLPGFVTESQIGHAIGLGDVVSRTASAIGIRPCGGCARRAAALNRWVTFSGRNR